MGNISIPMSNVTYDNAMIVAEVSVLSFPDLEKIDFAWEIAVVTGYLMAKYPDIAEEVRIFSNELKKGKKNA